MNLNEKQLEAIHHKDGPMLIIAGAGSGKTTVLSHRTEHLIKNEKVDPQQLLCLTFTNKAVHEWTQRITSLVGTEQAPLVWISTFHALCLSILRETIPFTVTSSKQARQIIQKIINEEANADRMSPEAKKSLTPNKVAKLISLLKSELVYPEFLLGKGNLKEVIDADRVKEIIRLELSSKEELHHFLHIYSSYQDALEKNEKLDVDDILLKTCSLFCQDQELLLRYQERFKYVMIDEYQDTNHAQYILATLIAKKHRNIASVGDDFQSVYGFRGSDIRNILMFDKDYPEALIIKLEKNYRSTKTILTAANQIIKHNNDQREKELFTSNEKGKPIFIHQADNNMDEATFIAEKIKELVASGYAYRDIAIFYRSNIESSTFETVLPEKNIPFRVTKDSSFFERKEVKDILSYLYLLVDPTDAYNFTQVVNYPKRGIGTTSIQKIIERAAGGNLIAVVDNPKGIDRLNAKTIEGLGQFSKLMKSLALVASSSSVVKLIEAVIEQTQYLQTFSELEKYVRQEKEQYVTKLLNIAAEMEEKDPFISVDGFLRSLTKTDVDATMTEEEFNKVNLTTIHSAKGLEFPVVFITGMVEQGFPSRFSVTDKHFEEERRLCYVAFTRAKKELYCTYPAHSFIKESDNPKNTVKIENVASRFLNEFDRSLSEQI